MKKIFLILGIIAVLGAGGALAGWFLLWQQPPQACLGKKCYDVFLAKTDAQRKQGLMFCEKMKDGQGVLFIFEKEGLYQFWMKNTLIPLDMAWLDNSGKIVFIARDSQPCKKEPCELINPNENATYVIEINAGEIEKTGMRIGDKIDLKNIANNVNDIEKPGSCQL
jgi:uncharacterized membrane protein (UPF0127 family)